MKYILTADNHFQYNQPICRTDDFITAQIEKMQFLKTLSEEHNAIILNAGDLTHKARIEKQEFFSMIFAHMPQMYGIAGNHDLMYHSLNYLENSALGVLIMVGAYKFIEKHKPLAVEKDLIYGFSFGQHIEKPNVKGINKTIALWHEMIYEKDDDYNFGKGSYAKEVLKTFPEYDFILTGDNHKTFVVEHEGRFLINPGSLTRDDAAQINHRPCVYLLNTENNAIEKIFVPIREGVISTEHLDAKKERDERLEAFITNVNSNYEIGFTFEKNLEKYFSVNQVEQEIKNIIYECTQL